MKLSIQIYSLFYSLFYGGIFYLLLDLFNKFTSMKKVYLKVILSWIFIMVIALLYFLGLLYINNGVLHIYFLLSIVCGYIVVYLILKRFTHRWLKYVGIYN